MNAPQRPLSDVVYGTAGQSDMGCRSLQHSQEAVWRVLRRVEEHAVPGALDLWSLNLAGRGHGEADALDQVAVRGPRRRSKELLVEVKGEDALIPRRHLLGAFIAPAGGEQHVSVVERPGAARGGGAAPWA